MREEISLLSASPPHGKVPNGLAMLSNDRSSSGFTAVNGDGQRHSSFRPDDSINVHAMPEAHPGSAEHSISPMQFHTHGWRDRVTESTENTEPAKRKRDDEHAKSRSERQSRPEQPYDIATGSPKRRLMTLDSAVDLTSPEDTFHGSTGPSNERRLQEVVHVGPYSRERSPVTRWNAGEPPPKPRPEVEAGLEASLKATLQQNQQAEEEQASPAPSSPGLDDQQMQDYSPDQNQAGSDGDPKKRKRNFSNRTKTGCHTCRSRKKKCDERKPSCANCERGGFVCGGYGPKPVGWRPPASAPRQNPVALQSKPPLHEPSHAGPTGYYQPSEEGRSYSHFGRIPPEPEPPRPPPIDTRDHMSRPSWQHSEAPHSYLVGRMPPSNFTQVSPMHGRQPSHVPMPPPFPPPMPPTHDLWSDHTVGSYRPTTSASGLISTRDSVTTSSSQRTAALALAYNPSAHVSDRDNMLLGRPFQHFYSDQLLNDKQQCKGALERYHDAARTSSGISFEERGRFFKAITDPTCRPSFRGLDREAYSGPRGFIGTGAVVETPFTCEYGYNIHLGEKVIIQAGCYMQDACKITIGDRTVVGPNVKFYGITANIEAGCRSGAQSLVTAGAIDVGADVFIGGDVTILPFRTIGRGAVIGAGSVVTKDVKENTVVAGNPAKFIRRIEQGPNIERHRDDIQDQNDKMLAKMWMEAKQMRDR